MMQKRTEDVQLAAFRNFDPLGTIRQRVQWADAEVGAGAGDSMDGGGETIIHRECQRRTMLLRLVPVALVLVLKIVTTVEIAVTVALFNRAHGLGSYAIDCHLHQPGKKVIVVMVVASSRPIPDFSEVTLRGFKCGTFGNSCTRGRKEAAKCAYICTDYCACTAGKLHLHAATSEVLDRTDRVGTAVCVELKILG
jgi:hypothetical protein